MKASRKKLIINCNDCFALYTFRLELLLELKEIYDLYIIARRDNYYPKLVDYGFDVIDSNVQGNKKSFFKDLSLIIFYKKIFRIIKPDIIINYTIKPHIYGTMVSKKTKVINFVSGVGSVFLKPNILFKISKYLYRFISRKVDLYVFINNDDLELFRDLSLIKNDYEVINGEGVNLDKFYKEVDFSIPPTFIFIGRLVKEKGIEDYLKAAKIIKEDCPETKFLVVGEFYDKDSVIDKSLFFDYVEKGIIEYLGFSDKINEILRKVHVVVLPSYREGLPISLVEALASKKFIIASDVAGCREVCVDGYNGFLSEAKNVDSIVYAINKYLNFEDKEILHENALNSSYQYDKEFYVKKMVDLIEKL